MRLPILFQAGLRISPRQTRWNFRAGLIQTVVKVTTAAATMPMPAQPMGFSFC